MIVSERSAASAVVPSITRSVDDIVMKRSRAIRHALRNRAHIRHRAGRGGAALLPARRSGWVELARATRCSTASRPSRIERFPRERRLVQHEAFRIPKYASAPRPCRMPPAWTRRPDAHLHQRLATKRDRPTRIQCAATSSVLRRCSPEQHRFGALLLDEEPKTSVIESPREVRNRDVALTSRGRRTLRTPTLGALSRPSSCAIARGPPPTITCRIHLRKLAQSVGVFRRHGVALGQSAAAHLARRGRAGRSPAPRIRRCGGRGSLGKGCTFRTWRRLGPLRPPEPALPTASIPPPCPSRTTSPHPPCASSSNAAATPRGTRAARPHEGTGAHPRERALHPACLQCDADPSRRTRRRRHGPAR